MRPMNYRHAFHAGNFADVVKHATLARIIAYLKEKPAAFRVIDTHAGAGLYDLRGPEASRTGEWREGIGKLLDAALAPAVRALLAPYLDAVASFNPAGLAHDPEKWIPVFEKDHAQHKELERDDDSKNRHPALTVYPGSPALVRAWLRTQDRMIACEREPGAAHALTAKMRADARVKAVAIDGYTALNAYVPPRERRGLVLVDPPFEHEDEFDRLGHALAAAHRKWPTGIYMLWYPIKDARATLAFSRRLARLGIPRILRAELERGGVRDPQRLAGSGLILVNPPWRLEAELAVLLPGLAQALGAGRDGARLDWLAGEK
jgi:23S rRNA (adenine2030-N6)-methyltransferase